MSGSRWRRFATKADRVLGVVVLLADISDTKAYERMKTRFISMVAHEIKAPIAAIESYMNVIEDGILDGHRPDQKSAATLPGPFQRAARPGPGPARNHPPGG